MSYVLDTCVISELMRRGAFAYQAAPVDSDMEALAAAAQAASERAGAAIDDALDFIAASNLRIEAMEAAAGRRPPAGSARPTPRKAA